MRRDGELTPVDMGRGPRRHRRPHRRHRGRARAAGRRPLRGHGRPARPARLRHGPRLLPGPRHRPALQRPQHRLLGQGPRAAAGERRAAHVPARPGAGVAAPRHRRQHRAVPRPRPDDLQPDRATCASCGPAAARSWWSIPAAPRRPSHADLHVPVRPGTDPALLAFARRPGAGRAARRRLPRRLRRRRQRRAPASGAWRRSTATAPPRSAACPPTRSTSCAAIVLAAGRVAIETGTGTTMNRSANLTEWLVWALSAVTGSLDRDGGATFNPGFLRPHRGRPAERPRRSRAAAAEPARPAPHRQRGDPVRGARRRDRGRPRAGPVRARSATRRWPSPATPACGGRWSSSTCWSPSTCTPRRPPRSPPTSCRWPTTSSGPTWSPATCRPSRSCASRRPSWRPPASAATQWWVFAELSRRLGLPAVRQPPARRRAGRARARRRGDRRGDGAPAPAIRGRRCGRRPTAWPTTPCRPGWLVPERLPHLLDVAPPELVAASSTGRGRRRRPVAGELVMTNRRTTGSTTRSPCGPSAPTLFIHPDDAAARGLADGDARDGRHGVGIVHGSGGGHGQRRRQASCRFPTVTAPSDVNQLLTTADVDPLNGMPIMSGFAVTVSAPAAGRRPPRPLERQAPGVGRDELVDGVRAPRPGLVGAHGRRRSGEAGSTAPTAARCPRPW